MVWMCFLVKSEKNRRGPFEGRPFSQGLQEQACPPAPSTHSFLCGAGLGYQRAPAGRPLLFLPAASDLLPPPLPIPHCKQGQAQSE